MRVLVTAKKLFLSAFVLFNTAMVVTANRPGMLLTAQSFFRETLPPSIGGIADWGIWYLAWYPYLTGTDLLATMFTTLSRTEWSFLITAANAAGENVLLPLPGQSKRTLLQRTFTDTKEGKFHNNLYADTEGRRKYARYLCRRYPSAGGAPTRAVRFELRWRQFASREEAARTGTHVEGPAYIFFLNEFPCQTQLP